MASQTLPLLLQPDILLIVVQWADLKSISALMRTNKVRVSWIFVIVNQGG